MSRKVGRVLITSRRREEIEAEPINVPPLTDEDGADLLFNLLEEFSIDAGVDRSKLKSIVNKIGCKPILIEFLAKYAAMTHATLERGVQEILKQESGDLGQFLFADSWGRIEEDSRRVFMVIAQLGGFVGDADKYLNISRTNGKERNLVLLQMAHARYTCAWKNGTLDGECGFAKINDLLSASKIGAPQTRVHNRHNDEIESLRAKVKNVFRRAGR